MLLARVFSPDRLLGCFLCSMLLLLLRPPEEVGAPERLACECGRLRKVD